MRNLSHPFVQREPSAVSVFLSGLPEPRRGRILTSGSVVDSWRHKPLAVRERLARERITRVRP